MKYLEGIRNIYSEIGVKNFYQKRSYINPHLSYIKYCLDWLITKINIGYFLDLSAGNGEVSKYLQSKDYLEFKGSDPYFSEIYTKLLNKKCFKLSFEEISIHGLPEKFDTIICSYALHLCPKSYFNNLLYNLSINCKYFVVISSSKFPLINEDYFELVNYKKIDKAHCRIFKSKL